MGEIRVGRGGVGLCQIDAWFWIVLAVSCEKVTQGQWIDLDLEYRKFQETNGLCG